MNILIGNLYCTIVDNSCIFIKKEASPAISITKESGFAICTPIEAGKPYPIVPRPPDVIQWLGLEKPKYCAAHI